MGRVIYSDRQIEDFIYLANMKGIHPAIRELGYPSHSTGIKWFEERGLTPPHIDSLMVKAAELKQFYSDSEKKYSLQVAMDAIVEKIQHFDQTADELNKLANALAKLIQTYQLIEGKSTQISETHKKDGTDLAINGLIEEMKQRNEEKQRSI